MAKYTSNYNLTKPASTDLYDVEVNNSNMEKIDVALHSVEDKVFPLNGLHAGDMNELVTPGQYRLRENTNLPTKGYYGQCFVGRGQTGADTVSQMVISYAYNRMFFRGAQYKDGVWKWEEWSEVYSTLNPPSIASIGIVFSDVEPSHKAGQIWLQPIE